MAALGSRTVGVISHHSLRDFLYSHPEIALALWRQTLADAAMFREWVVNLGRRSCQERIAHLICEVFSRLDEIGLTTEISGNNSFSWSVTQRDLADATGMSVVHVNRSLQQLRGRGVIEATKTKVTILNWLGLQSLAGFKADYLVHARQGHSAAIYQQI